jgi:myo-inositol-1(or 4)-monophosphatase
MLPDIQILKKIIIDTAKEEILPRFNKISYEVKTDGSLVTEADLSADKRIREALAQAYPEIAFLSEEMKEEEQTELLESSSQIWCLDPLDGTSNFAAGIPLFATSLALIVNDEVEIGLSYDVVRDEMFTAIKGQGAWLNDEPLKCSNSPFTLGKSVAIFDFKYLTPELAMRLILDKPYRSQRNIGASVLEWVWMAAGRGQVYLHGGMKLWDMAAGSLILSEAGGYSCTLEGEAVFKATMIPRSVIISHDQELFLQWKAYILDDNKTIDV